MADDADRAADQNERELQAVLGRRRPTEKRTGFCVWCRNRIDAAAIYCDADCRADHESSLKFNGRRW